MTKIADLCRHVRSKNAGPFWVTVDFFLPDLASLDRLATSPLLSDELVAERLGTDAAMIKRFVLPDLCVLKLSYPRATPQGGTFERDMHGGQQYVRLLDVEV